MVFIDFFIRDEQQTMENVFASPHAILDGFFVFDHRHWKCGSRKGLRWNLIFFCSCTKSIEIYQKGKIFGLLSRSIFNPFTADGASLFQIKFRNFFPHRVKEGHLCSRAMMKFNKKEQKFSQTGKVYWWRAQKFLFELVSGIGERIYEIKIFRCKFSESAGDESQNCNFSL